MFQERSLNVPVDGYFNIPFERSTGQCMQNVDVNGPHH